MTVGYRVYGVVYHYLPTSQFSPLFSGHNWIRLSSILRNWRCWQCYCHCSCARIKFGQRCCGDPVNRGWHSYRWVYYYTLVTVVYHSTPLFLSPAPIDYTAITNMQLTFNVSVLSQTVMITIADGAVLEGPETFSVTLATSDNAVMLNTMTAAVSIQEDNDSRL